MSLLIEYILYYLLVGTGVGFFIDIVIRWIGDEVKWGERIIMITLWPIMGITFIWNFIKGLFE